MNLAAAASIAREHIRATCAGQSPRDIRLESFLYDDHLMVWSLAIGFLPAGGARVAKLVRVSEANRTVLSVADA